MRRLASDGAAYRKGSEIWLEGEHLAAAYVQRGGVPAQALIAASAWQRPPLRALAERAAEIAIVDDGLLASLSTLESPAPIAFVVPWNGPGVPVRGRPTVVLDRLQDAGNVGNILRSAAAFGFEQVVALKGTVALWSPKVLRAAMGAHFGLRLVEAAGEADLDALDVPLFAASSHAELALHDAALPWPCGWLLGHEGQGVSAALMRRCAAALRIPQPGGEESLNVAAAAAICLYESMRRRAVAAG